MSPLTQKIQVHGHPDDAARVAWTGGAASVALAAGTATAALAMGRAATAGTVRPAATAMRDASLRIIAVSFGSTMSESPIAGCDAAGLGGMVRSRRRL